MRYDEKEEIEATGEWLMRMNDAGFAEELEYVPSQLWKMGVAPVDVVDRLDYLRDHGRMDSRASLAGARPSSVMVLERPKVIEAEADTIIAIVVEEEVDPLLMVVEAPVRAEPSMILNYDSYGLWEWAGPIESILEESMRMLLAPEPGLHEFNELASLTRSAKRTRGKRARSSAKSTS